MGGGNSQLKHTQVASLTFWFPFCFKTCTDEISILPLVIYLRSFFPLVQLGLSLHLQVNARSPGEAAPIFHLDTHLKNSWISVSRGDSRLISPVAARPCALSRGPLGTRGKKKDDFNQLNTWKDIHSEGRWKPRARPFWTKKKAKSTASFKAYKKDTWKVFFFIF